jgi:hypothetical protein
MPSSFSPNLRLELIANGSQAGNWGNTTNTNLGTLIEQSISGYVAVSVTSADQAFTHADGAADQARNAMIELTTTTGAAFNVYAPPSPKTYVIYNASAHTATIFNSTVIGNTTAAGTGVVVPAGESLTVFTDGADFRVQASAAPTQAPGTNNAKLANTAFVQTAIQAFLPSGTKMLFQQTAAPTGWTKDTTHNNKALRVVSGTAGSGGSVAFTTAFASQAVSGSIGSTTAGGTVANHTLSTARIPSHSHTTTGFRTLSGPVSFGGTGATMGASSGTGNTGGGEAHSHGFSGASHTHSFTGSAIDLEVQYVDLIIATKD